MAVSELDCERIGAINMTADVASTVVSGGATAIIYKRLIFIKFNFEVKDPGIGTAVQIGHFVGLTTGTTMYWNTPQKDGVQGFLSLSTDGKVSFGAQNSGESASGFVRLSGISLTA